VSAGRILRAEHLSVEYAARRPVRAVRDVSFELARGEVLGIAGESGCGKSTLAYALARLLRPPAMLAGGSVAFTTAAGEELDLLKLEGEELRRFRWNKVSMVFQSAMNALNPVASIGRQFSDIFAAHRPEMDHAARLERARELLEMVGIDAGRVRSFPHELSGGMRQRVVIAMALALSPELVIMDEPTTALDVVVQREILDEIERLREELDFSVIFITHDLSLLLEVSDWLAVMYAGQFVEYAPSAAVATAPAHPYTLGLLGSFPDMRGERRELRGIPGSPPDLRGDFAGCPFAERCPFAFEPCATVPPQLRSAPAPASVVDGTGSADGWLVACHLHDPAYGAPGIPVRTLKPPGGTARSGAIEDSAAQSPRMEVSAIPVTGGET
jgi:peptide/nickel transport system ATP-binding protein